MKRYMRVLSLFLVMALFLCSCASIDSNNGVIVTTSLNNNALVGNIPCEFPLTNENVSLNILFSGHDGVAAEDVYVWQKYEEMTGITTNWTTVPKSERSEKVKSILMNQNDYDLILRCKISATKLIQYGQSGLILDLTENDLLQTYAPNCWAYLQSHPETLASIMNPDGSIYALPQVNSGAELRVSRKIFINKTWLENVNMEVPTTTEELYELLKAFKEQDANGNGDPNDEIPMCPYDWSSIQDCLFGPFGLANRGIHNQIVDYDEDTGDVRFIAASDEYKSYLKYLNKLYSEGLLDKYCNTITMEQWSTNAEEDRIGVFFSTNLASLPADKMDNWIAVGEALEGPDGIKEWTAIRANFHSTGAAVIPTTCENPELVLQWLDYFWTDEGTLFYHMGIEGETFVANEDGTFDYTPAIYDEIDSGTKSFDDVVACYSPYPGGNNPTVETAPYFMGGEMADIPAQAARELFEYGPDEYWPSFTFTPEESEQLEIVQNDISKYVEESRIAFITGEKSFDDWEEYLAQLELLGEDDLLHIYRNAVDRYNILLTSP